MESYYACAEEGCFEDEENKVCFGIGIGVVPLKFLLIVLAAATVLFVNRKPTLAMMNIARLEISFAEGLQIAIFGICLVYALMNYAIRRKRNFDFSGPEGIAYTVYIVLLIVGMLLRKFNSAVEDGEENENENESENDQASVGGRSTVGGRSSGRGSLNVRMSLDTSKSIWEGGAKGALGKGMIKSLSTRGGWGGEIVSSPAISNITGVTGSQEQTGSGDVLVDSNHVLNPGFI
jgi:hypothetical protein